MSGARGYGSDIATAPPPPDAPEIVWFRRDLRLRDNPAWADAVLSGRPVVALYVLDPRLLDGCGDLRRRMLLGHLHALDESLRERGGRLRVHHGDPTTVVPKVFDEAGAHRLVVNSDTTPYATRRDGAVATALEGRVAAHWGTLVHEPGRVRTAKGTLSRVFTPFHKAWEQAPWSDWVEMARHPSDVRIVDDAGDGLPDLDGEPPEPCGEDAALARLRRFDEHGADDYLRDRDLPAIAGTSSLSADLRFGTVSPRRIATTIGTATKDRAGFVRQLAWRDWYAHTLAEEPDLARRPLNGPQGEVEWTGDDREFEAWRDGRTGYPIVDAGMRELAATGRIHNRVRMLCASFLVKDLLIDWRRGERWFRRELIDGDVAQNAGNWQWVAGTGPDAAPYFRVFNPTLQSRKFDTDGEYIRRWVPELAELDSKEIHEPAAVGPLELATKGVILGDTYPEPIVDHHAAKDRAVAAYNAAKERAQR